MSTLIQNAEALLAMEKQYRAVLAVGEYLRSIGSIEQAEAEARLRRDAMVQQEADAQAKLTTVRTAVQQAEQQVEQAAASAWQLVADAKTAAEDILAAANDEGARRIASVQAQVDALFASLDGLREEQRRAVESLQATRAEYDDLAAKLTQLRNTAASLAGR